MTTPLAAASIVDDHPHVLRRIAGILAARLEHALRARPAAAARSVRS